MNLSYFHYAWYPSWRATTVPVVSISEIFSKLYCRLFNPLCHSLNTLPRMQETKVSLFFKLVITDLQDGCLSFRNFPPQPYFQTITREAGGCAISAWMTIQQVSTLKSSQDLPHSPNPSTTPLPLCFGDSVPRSISFTQS